MATKVKEPKCKIRNWNAISTGIFVGFWNFPWTRFCLSSSPNRLCYTKFLTRAFSTVLVLLLWLLCRILRSDVSSLFYTFQSTNLLPRSNAGTYLAFGTKICSFICPRTLFMAWSEQFPNSEDKRPSISNVKYYPQNVALKFGEYHSDIPQF